METLKIITPDFSDARGDISNILQGKDFSHLAIITCAAGSVRGNHWHPNDTQFMFMLSGRYEIYTKQMGYGDASPVTVQLVDKPMTLAYCPPGIAHAYRFLEDTVFLNIGKDNRETERFSEHTIRVPIVDSHGNIVWGDVINAD